MNSAILPIILTNIGVRLMDDLGKDVKFMLTRLAKLMTDAGITLTTDESHNRIIVERPNAALKGVVIIELRGAKT